ncbi:MAG: class I SAM-dependent methyltransferase [Anaerolineaceae bacterium]|nr:class I SAM-dependent methyltransferase [Anaerolineaceae bacterium]
MKFNYQETTSDLLTRIDIHNKYGSRNIDEWMMGLLHLEKGMKILDVGCGSGKQCFSYLNELNEEADISGGDINPELLDQARKENSHLGGKVTFVELDFNKRFPYPDNQFDLLSCCFSIYYAENIPFTIAEMHRVLKPGGRLFTTGPLPENKELFYEIIREATDKPIPPMPGSSRFSTEIWGEIKQVFSSGTVHTFENPLTFDSVQPFIEYTRASLSEDRKLWGSFFQNKNDFENIMQQITRVAERRFTEEGKLVMTKVVGGILAVK